MACYEVVWKRSAERELRRLPPAVIARVVELARSLASDPRPRGARKLAGVEKTWRYAQVITV